MPKYCKVCKYTVGPFKLIEDSLLCEECINMGIDKLIRLIVSLKKARENHNNNNQPWYNKERFNKIMNYLFPE